MLPATDFTELRNLHLLKAMGVSVYHPRYRLPGAADSRICSWPEESSPSTITTAPRLLAQKDPEITPGFSAHQPLPAEVHAEQPEPAGKQGATIPASARVSLGAALQDVKEKPDVISELETRLAVAAEPVPATSSARGTQAHNTIEVPAFQALFCPVNHQLAVLVQLPALAGLQLQEKEAALLNNILRWLGLAGLAPVTPHVFRWPLPGLKQKGQHDAGLGLHAFLDQAARESGARHILVFGQLLNGCLDAAGASRHGLQFTGTYSISELLSVPQLKREAWQSLLPLYQRSKSGSGF